MNDKQQKCEEENMFAAQNTGYSKMGDDTRPNVSSADIPLQSTTSTPKIKSSESLKCDEIITTHQLRKVTCSGCGDSHWCPNTQILMNLLNQTTEQSRILSIEITQTPLHRQNIRQSTNMFTSKSDIEKSLTKSNDAPDINSSNSLKRDTNDFGDSQPKRVRSGSLSEVSSVIEPSGREHFQSDKSKNVAKESKQMTSQPSMTVGNEISIDNISKTRVSDQEVPEHFETPDLSTDEEIEMSPRSILKCTVIEVNEIPKTSLDKSLTSKNGVPDGTIETKRSERDDYVGHYKCDKVHLPTDGFAETREDGKRGTNGGRQSGSLMDISNVIQDKADLSKTQTSETSASDAIIQPKKRRANINNQSLVNEGSKSASFEGQNENNINGTEHNVSSAKIPLQPTTSTPKFANSNESNNNKNGQSSENKRRKCDEILTTHQFHKVTCSDCGDSHWCPSTQILMNLLNQTKEQSRILSIETTQTAPHDTPDADSSKSVDSLKRHTNDFGDSQPKRVRSGSLSEVSSVIQPSGLEHPQSDLSENVEKESEQMTVGNGISIDNISNTRVSDQEVPEHFETPDLSTDEEIEVREVEKFIALEANETPETSPDTSLTSKNGVPDGTVETKRSERDDYVGHCKCDKVHLPTDGFAETREDGKRGTNGVRQSGPLMDISNVIQDKADLSKTQTSEKSASDAIIQPKKMRANQKKKKSEEKSEKKSVTKQRSSSRNINNNIKNIRS